MGSQTTTNPLAAAGVLDDFLPKSRPSGDADIVRADKATTRSAAQERGFFIDNLATTIVRAKRNGAGKPSKSHTLRLYIDDLNRFQLWCNDNNYSQARGFEIMLDRMLPRVDQTAPEPTR